MLSFLDVAADVDLAVSAIIHVTAAAAAAVSVVAVRTSLALYAATMFLIPTRPLHGPGGPRAGPGRARAQTLSVLKQFLKIKTKKLN